MTDLFSCPARFDTNHHFAHYTYAKALKGMLGCVKCVENSKMCMFATSIPYLHDQDELKTGEKYAPSIKGLNNDAYNNTYIISLCRNYNSRCMWEEYSIKKSYSEKEKHIGVILLLDTSKMNAPTGDVLYDVSRGRSREIKEHYQAAYNPKGHIDGLPEEYENQIQSYLVDKGTHKLKSNLKQYKYKKEDERRVTIESDIKPCYKKDAKNRDVYYIKHKFDKNALIEVILENDSDKDLIDLLDKNKINYTLKEDFDKQFSVS